ncbi:hypothetical protein [Phyllobacterium sp. SB3]
MIEYVWVLVVLAGPVLLGIVIAAKQWLAVRSGPKGSGYKNERPKQRDNT